MGLFRHRHRILSASLPTAQSYSPTTGAVGDTITLTGTGFGAVQGAGGVTISGRSATIVSWSATSIVFKVPAQTSYPSNFGGVVVITDAGASSLAPGFFVTTGGAAHFTAASSQLLSTPSNASLQLGSGSLTLSAWVYLDSLGAFSGIIAKGNPGAAGGEYALLYRSAAARFRFDLRNTANTASLGMADAVFGAPAINTWYWVVGWYDSVLQTANLSINNGTPTTASWTVGVNVAANALALGQYATGFHDGRIDAAALWGRVLTSGERTSLYNAGVGVNYASALALGGTLLNNLAAWWDLDDSGGSGATWVDRLGVSNLTAGVGTAAPTSVRGVR